METGLQLLGEFIRYALTAAGLLLKAVIAWASDDPCQAFTVLLGFAMLLGTVIQTGTRGVLYRFGRARRELEPGFHFLLPWFDQVQKVPTRAITIDVAAQRVTTRDGMVYEVDANVVYTLSQPTKALVEVDDWKHGVATRVALTVQELVRQSDREAVREREDLDQALMELLAPRLAPWGVEVLRAGFTSIAPTAHTLHVTQQRARARERAEALEVLRAGGLPDRVALALLGADRRLVGRSRRRYARAQVAARARLAAARAAAAARQERAARGEEEAEPGAGSAKPQAAAEGADKRGAE